jgi:hypothetical protein
MSSVFPPSASEQERLPEDVEGLLRDFFQSALPQEWPAVPVPQPQAGRGFFQLRSRITLAASVAILLIGSFWLSSLVPQREASPLRLAPGVPTEASRPGGKRLHAAPLNSTRETRPHAAGDTHRR